MSEAGITIKQKKEWAQLLFVKDDLTQKEIAVKVGVSEQTISKWVNTEDWEKMRLSILRTKPQEIMRLYAQFSELNKKIEERPEGFRHADSKEMDIIIKLTASIKNLENEISVTQITDVFIKYFNWLRATDLKEAQKQLVYADGFIKTHLAKK